MPSIPSSDILFESPNIRVWRNDTEDTTRTVVTFDSYTDNRTLDRPGFGEAFLKSRGLSAIHVISRDNDWYQYPEIIEALDKIAAITTTRGRTLTYGTSMGGYAAIRFADRVGAQAVVSISPQYSIDPAKAPFEERWKTDAGRIRFLDALDGPITSSAQIILPYDPAGPDRRHAEMIAADVSVTPVRIWYAGHSVPALLSEAKMLAPLLSDALNGAVDAKAIERLMRQRKKTLSVYYAELSMRQTHRGGGLAVPLARHALKINNRSDIAKRALADALQESGDAAGAIAVYEDLLSGKRHLQHLIAYSQLLAKAGELDRAIHLAEEARDIAPGVGFIHYWLSSLFEKQGKPSEALANAQVASAVEPANAVYGKTARRLARKNHAGLVGVVNRLANWFKNLRITMQ